ncbi:hypothetical protein Tco_0250236, partial [Tanacetum coccineum]
MLSYPHDNKKSEVQHDSRELTSKGKEKVDDNGPRKFPITRNMMSSANGELSVTSKDKAPDVRINEPPISDECTQTADIVATSTLPGVSRTPALVEPPKKKRAFQISAPEDDSFETDDDDETQVNGTCLYCWLKDINKRQLWWLTSLQLQHFREFLEPLHWLKMINKFSQ